MIWCKKGDRVIVLDKDKDGVPFRDCSPNTLSMERRIGMTATVISPSTPGGIVTLLFDGEEQEDQYIWTTKTLAFLDKEYIVDKSYLKFHTVKKKIVNEV